jgi:carbon-monoxide dehydrogenase large subunit
MGEGGAIAPPAVLIGAVNDALSAMGAAELLDTPLTPRRVLAAIEAGRPPQTVPAAERAA